MKKDQIVSRLPYPPQPFADCETVYDMAYVKYLSSAFGNGDGQLLATSAGLLFIDWADREGTIEIRYPHIKKISRKWTIAPNVHKLRVVSSPGVYDFYMGKMARGNFHSIVMQVMKKGENTPEFSESIMAECLRCAAAHWYALP